MFDYYMQVFQLVCITVIILMYIYDMFVIKMAILDQLIKIAETSEQEGNHKEERSTVIFVKREQ